MSILQQKARLPDIGKLVDRLRKEDLIKLMEKEKSGPNEDAVKALMEKYNSKPTGGHYNKAAQEIK